MLNTIMVLLNELKEGNVKYKEMIIMLEENKIRVGLEYTFYDYEELQPSELLDILEKYSYDWYNSVEIHIYE